MIESDARKTIAGRVSRETMERLELFVVLLEKWQKTINLVAPSTLPHVWGRHILDSAQLLDHVPVFSGNWVDFGSGGGFPGLVCAIIAAETHPRICFTLVDADLRKGAFLRETARQLGIPVGIMTRRIEDLPPSEYDIVSARALAPLDVLCRLAQPHLSDSGICLFQKGARYREEIEAAQLDWQMTYTVIESITDLDAVLLKIEKLRHV